MSELGTRTVAVGFLIKIPSSREQMRCRRFAKTVTERDVTRREQYRQYAAECVRLALQPINDDRKALLLEMAERWRQLAEHVEQDEEGASPAPR
jgi:hypothetical protein